MNHAVYLVQPPTLLDDLLEDSARIYHRHCAVIQSAFHEQWVGTIDQELAAERERCPGASEGWIESQVRGRLEDYRVALRRRGDELIAEERGRRDERDAAIRNYVGTLPETAANRAA
jgi:hypothetical protein